jgi:hypothetical protein
MYDALLAVGESVVDYNNIQPGTVVIFGLIFAPLYSVLIGWFAGEPSDAEIGFLGVGYLASFIASLWGGLFVLTVILGVLFW